MLSHSKTLIIFLAATASLSARKNTAYKEPVAPAPILTESNYSMQGLTLGARVSF
jgi:hypothetical protein